MKTRFIISLGAAMSLLTACIPSVEPFYRAEDVQFDSRLLGEWQMKSKDEGDSQTWQFEAAEEKTYKLTVTEKEGKQGAFAAHLFKLGDHLFLDIVPLEFKPDPEQAELVGFALFPGHLVLRVSQLEPSLKMAFCDFDWLAKLLENNPGAIAHRVENKRGLLTATTRDLQRFVLEHLGQGELFSSPDEFLRKAEPVAVKSSLNR